MKPRYTFRLKPGRDEDLITWLESLGEGERSFFIRNALRKAITKNANIVDIPMKQRYEAKIEPAILIPDIKDNQEYPDESETIDSKLNKLLDNF